MNFPPYILFLSILVILGSLFFSVLERDRFNPEQANAPFSNQQTSVVINEATQGNLSQKQPPRPAGSEIYDKCAELKGEERNECIQDLFDYSDKNRLQGSAPSLEKEEIYSKDGLAIQKLPAKQRQTFDDQPFSKFTASDLNINDEHVYSAAETEAPFKYGRGIASGDYNNDYMPDLAFATSRGVILYKNDGDYSFSKQTVSQPEGRNVFLVSFVDIDNDGWQDLFLTAYGGQNYFLLNDGGAFNSFEVVEVAGTKKVLTMSAAFADIDNNSMLDLALGNWSSEMQAPHHLAYSENEFYLNSGLDFDTLELEDTKGETLSILFSDFNHDNAADLLIGNDFASPDNYFFGRGNGGFKKIVRQDRIFPYTAQFTMAIDSGDLNNDLKLDIFSADMILIPEKTPLYCHAVYDESYRKKCEDHVDVISRVSYRHKDSCEDIASAEVREQCETALLLEFAKNNIGDIDCASIPEHMDAQKELCLLYTSELGMENPEVRDSDLEQKQKNVLFMQQDDGKFNETATLLNADRSGWSWNSKIADLNNDQWQDIYVGNGLFHNNVSANSFFLNDKGQKFKPSQSEFGLDDFISTPSFTLADIDMDGDLDIVATGVNSPSRIFINNNDQHSIRFALNDSKGNKFGIGAKIIIRYGDNNSLHQIRELKLGGGFLSFDQPVMHFGLGEYEKVKQIEIFWPDGTKNSISQPFQANALYIISR